MIKKVEIDLSLALKELGYQADKISMVSVRKGAAGVVVVSFEYDVGDMTEHHTLTTQKPQSFLNYPPGVR